ncbi:PGRS repeat-containing protein [Mycobacterium sp.]|uniref:PGRS repeat-containing protein n=1 Tax=Mycobacterium sp. TaxID=1785 RepID=UPI003C73E19A
MPPANNNCHGKTTSQLGGNGGDAQLIGNGGNTGAGATPATPGAGGSGGLLFGLDGLPGQ